MYLHNTNILQLNSRILTFCSSYAEYTYHFARYIQQSDPTLSSATSTGSARSSQSVQYDPVKLKKLEELLQKYEDNFTRHLKILLDTLNYLAATETVVFLSLCARLSTSSDEGASGVGAPFVG